MDTGELLMQTARTLDEVTARLMVNSIAIEELIKLLPEESRIGIAPRLQERVNQSLQAHEGRMSTKAATMAQYHLRALLGNPGPPPQD